MRTGSLCCALALAVAAIGCGGKKNEGLPPATEWNAGSAGNAGMVNLANQASPPAAGGATDPDNPHAGLDMGGGGDDPHAGALGGDPANPHAGMAMGGTDVSKLGLAPPDPNRAIDPNHRITGVIKLDPKLAVKLARGTAVFLVVKKPDANGQPVGTPLAVEKLSWDKDELPFEITDHDAMIAGTELSGDVVVTAHYDTDGDAISKTPGDLLGAVKVTIPADKVALVLDKVIQ